VHSLFTPAGRIRQLGFGVLDQLLHNAPLPYGGFKFLARRVHGHLLPGEIRIARVANPAEMALVLVRRIQLARFGPIRRHFSDRSEQRPLTGLDLFAIPRKRRLGRPFRREDLRPFVFLAFAKPKQRGVTAQPIPIVHPSNASIRSTIVSNEDASASPWRKNSLIAGMR